MIDVCYCSPFLDASGYGEASRNYIMALYSAGANIKTEKVSFTGKVHYDTRAGKLAEELSSRDVPYRIKILHVTPDSYPIYMERNKYHIGHLFWETDRLPKGWIEKCNLMDEIWTGTQLNANTITNSGVKVPVKVIPEAIDTEIPDVKPYKLPNFNGMVFYSILDWNERKNPRTLLFSYWKEFKGVYDVCLLLKTHKRTYSSEGAFELIEEIKRWKNSLGFKDTPRVFVNTDLMNEEEKYRLHKTGDVYVSAHRGEGWGLPQVEASLFKNPTISVKYGGVHEYWKNSYFYPVEYELVEIDKVYNKYYEPGMKWAQASEESLRAHMRKCYEMYSNPKQKSLLKKKGYDCKIIAEAIFNYKSVGEQMMERLAEIQKELM